MPSQILFIAGAPESKSLEWDSLSLLNEFTGPIARFANIPQPEVQAELSLATAAGAKHAAWRSIELSRQHLPTGYSQINDWLGDSHSDAAFFVPANLSFTSTNDGDTAHLPSQASTVDSVEEVLSQFYEQSFAVHADMSSSQLSTAASQSQPDSSSSLASTLLAARILPNPFFPPGAHLRTLAGIPNARYLQSIHPQTMTVNLVVGIITVSAPRAITTRRGAAVDIVEFLVGDESKSGFGINYWLDPSPSNSHLNSKNTRSRLAESKTASVEGKLHKIGEKAGDGARTVLETLRPQDIVLLTNVALSSFRGQVYGQSLRRGMTKISLLFRQRVDRMDVGGCYSVADLDGNDENSDVVLTKTKNVRQWVRKFVGPGVVVVRKGGNGSKGKVSVEVLKEVLPPDTQ